MLSGNNEYVSIFLVYPNDFIRQQLAYFPSIENLKYLIEKQISAISSSPTFMSAKMFDCVHTILHSPYSETTHRFHTDIGKHLLRLMLQEVTRAGHTEFKYSLEYLERIHAAKNYIDSNLLRHNTIHQIARKVGLNEIKLKRGFKEVFGKGLYGYRKQERLKIAKAALEQTTKPIKEISKSTGYKSSNNFSIAFKKLFGISPSQIRKKVTI